MTLFECKNLSTGYDGKIIQKNLNLKVESGDYIYILGENGSGKTTLLKTLLGFLKPIEGEIIFSDHFKKNSIGYLPQQSSIQKDFPATVWEIVLSGCQGRLSLFPFYSKKEKERARTEMKKLGILGFEKKSFKELSGGQQQRVLLARALCAADQILILDEPAKGFDSKITEEMYKEIERLNNEGLTVIMISHDNEAAKKYAKKTLNLVRDRSNER